jgi:hypothetical protein
MARVRDNKGLIAQALEYIGVSEIIQNSATKLLVHRPRCSEKTCVLIDRFKAHINNNQCIASYVRYGSNNDEVVYGASYLLKILKVTKMTETLIEIEIT